MDINRYAILFAIKKDWILELDKNFMELFGFEKNIFKEGYHRSTKTPNLDKTKYLKIYCNLINNKEDNEFLTNVFIKNDISDQFIYENNNNYKQQKILDTTFIVQSICLCIKREVIPNKGIPLPQSSDRSPETPPKFAAPPDVEKCHFRATPIWIKGKIRDF